MVETDTIKDWPKQMVNFEPAAHEALKEAAKRNYRSLAAEVRYRIQKSLEEEGLLDQ